MSEVRLQSSPASTLLRLTLAAAAVAVSGAGQAGTITVQGSVTALTHVSQMDAAFVAAGFETTSPLPLNAYSALGMNIAAAGASFSSILPGMVSSGTASVVTTYSGSLSCADFPSPIGGGGSCSDNVALLGMVATFSAPVTQFGATLSKNGAEQYITAWAIDGSLIGQVKWSPSGDASFVGIDTGVIPIALVALGNDDVFGGAIYDVGGSTVIWDNAVWNASIPEPSTLTLLGLGLAGLAATRRRKQ